LSEGGAFGRTLGGPHVVRPPKNDELWIRVGKGAVLRREFDYFYAYRTARLQTISQRRRVSCALKLTL